MSAKETKKELRNQFLTKRKALSPEQRTAFSKAIAKHFLQSDFVEADTFHIYISIDKFNEIETQHIIKALWASDKTVVVPKMKGKELQNCVYASTTSLTENNWGILEPATCTQIPHHQIDIVLVPMLISDIHGNRIGYGGGFYDRFLPHLRQDCKLVGINFFEPIPQIEAQGHDIPLDYLITPNGLQQVVN